MFKLFKQAFKTTNEGIILAIPLTLFWWIITLYMNFSIKVVDTYSEMILSGITMLFMTSAFFAGWFYMTKKCVTFSKKHFIFDKDKNSESIKLLKEMPKGIGKFFLFFLEACVIIIGLIIIVGSLISLLSLPFLKEITNILITQNVNIYSPQDVSEFINKLPPEQTFELLRPVLKLGFTLAAVPTVFSFLLLLWMPEIVYTKKNPIIALFTSIAKVFKKFWKSLLLFIYITIVQLLASALGPLMLKNPFLYLLIIILYFYIIVYIVVLIFSYYDEEFRSKLPKDQDKPKA